MIPFLLISEPTRALRASNAIAIVMLWAGGYSLGRHSGMQPWLVALAMAVMGAVLAAITIALGG